jgi:hypothetical protein
MGTYSTQIMIQSKFIKDVLDLLLDGDELGLSLRKQLPFLTDTEYEYTNAGSFVTFSHSNEVNEFKVSMEGTFIDGVEIISTELGIEAEAILFVKEGIINFLEIWCYVGQYPSQDLSQYLLRQIWQGSPNKELMIGQP